MKRNTPSNNSEVRFTSLLPSQMVHRSGFPASPSSESRPRFFTGVRSTGELGLADPTPLREERRRRLRCGLPRGEWWVGVATSRPSPGEEEFAWLSRPTGEGSPRVRGTAQPSADERRRVRWPVCPPVRRDRRRGAGGSPAPDMVGARRRGCGHVGEQRERRLRRRLHGQQPHTDAKGRE